MLKSKSFSVRFVLATLIACTTTLPLRADSCHTEHADHQPTAEPAAAESVHGMSIPDTVLLDQDGRQVRFYTDLVKDRVVAINFIFTTCTTVCPPMGANFSRLQKMLGDKAGKDIQMISVSVDPAVDTPQRLNAWGAKFGRQEGWTLVTGDKPAIDKLLKALKVFTPDKTDHSPIVLVGDDARGEWTRAYGLAPPAKLAELIGTVSTQRQLAEDAATDSVPDVAAGAR